MARSSYLLVIMDSAGGATRRIRIPKRWVHIGAAVLALGGLGPLLLFAHGAYQYPNATQARILKQENTHLERVLTSLDHVLPHARFESLRNQEAFRRVWVQSGIGQSPTSLGIGPLADHGESDAHRKSPLLTLDPETTPDIPLNELNQTLKDVTARSAAVQNRIESTLEYFEDAKRLLSNTPSIRPVDDGWITSHYGRRRDPINNGWVMHKGLDMGGYTGLPIRAPAKGVVVWTGNRGGYGKTVVLDHGYGIQTHYAHLHQYRVRRGDSVDRGQIIAEMGSTGKSTGPHLHYDVRRNGEPIDPIHFILD